MPYIDQADRDIIDPLIAALDDASGLGSMTDGEMNYTISRLLKLWLGETPNYSAFNKAIGVLECAKLELYRRMIAPYEDKKMEAHGDVYGV